MYLSLFLEHTCASSLSTWKILLNIEVTKTNEYTCEKSPSYLVRVRAFKNLHEFHKDVKHPWKIHLTFTVHVHELIYTTEHLKSKIIFLS